jgi:hypothetical protein
MILSGISIYFISYTITTTKRKVMKSNNIIPTIESIIGRNLVKRMIKVHPVIISING